jgi:hypothetical protein
MILELIGRIPDWKYGQIFKAAALFLLAVGFEIFEIRRTFRSEGDTCLTANASFTVVRFVLLALAVAAGLVAGGFSAFRMIDASASRMTLDVGGWAGDLSVGSPSSSPYVRASISERALMALSREETIYFFRDRDADGNPFREACSYEISGNPLPARWWSVTLYADDDFLAENPDKAHSVSASTAELDSRGKWRARIAPAPAESGAWLSTRNARSFSLVVRLYNPEPEALRTPERLKLPVVQQLTCAGASR